MACKKESWRKIYSIESGDKNVKRPKENIETLIQLSLADWTGA